MPEVIDICSLDYLLGTLATAYKGLVTSLIAKDFCMTESGGRVALKGTVLAMPAGSYQAFLMQEGIELARTEMHGGFFELLADTAQIREKKNLQIDIVQKGRHIGTFLLSREKAGGMYRSALELSEDLKGINFQRLTALLQGKPGLLKRAEDIISKIFTTKKDWRDFSEEINSFAKDLFWSEREAFYHWYDILADYSHKAAGLAVDTSRGKAIANFLFLIELPLENETDEGKLRRMVDPWLRKAGSATIYLSYAYPQVRKVLTELHSRFPDAQIGAMLGQFLNSLKERAMRTPALSPSTLEALRGILPEEDLSRLGSYSEENRRDFLSKMTALVPLINPKRYPDILRRIDETGFSFSDDTEMTDTFFAVIGKNINKENAPILSGALSTFLPLFETLSPEAYRRGVLNIAGLMRGLIESGHVAACAALLGLIEKGGGGLKEDVLLSREMASSIYAGGDGMLMEQYKTLLKRMRIPSPRVTGFSTDTWAEIVPPLHLQRLTEFLAIIRLDSVRFRDLLVHLICNLSVTGVFVPDDRLFQREISAYLNAGGLQENFLLHFLLLKKLPVFFNEVGASGKLRDYTTEIDAWGNDTVLYFLRKQVHVNASNSNISLVEKIIRTWLYRDPEILRDAVPDEILNRLDTSLLSRYSAALRVFFESFAILEGGEVCLEKLLTVSEGAFREGLGKAEADEEILSKILLLIRIYREIVKKYSTSVGDASLILQGSNDLSGRLKREISRMKELYEIIISPEKTVARESFYFKRHIAFGIPSVIGSYHESKFDALSEMFRTEETIRVILENIISSVGMRSGSFSPADPGEWTICLEGIRDLFKIYGLENFQVEEIITVLNTNRLRLSQVVDLLRIWQRELTGMVESITDTFYMPFTEILRMFPGEDLPEHPSGRRNAGSDLLNKTTDAFIRDIMSSLTGFVELDRLLERLGSFLNGCLESGQDDIFAVSNALQSENDFFRLDDLSVQDAMILSPLLGGKAKNLAYLKQNGLPVPSGIVFSAGKTGEYQQFTGDEGFISVLKTAVKNMEDRTGSTYGGGVDPLFLSVRSGSYISMPGILSSILFCGMNRETLGGFIGSTGNRWLAYDSYRRFIEHFGTIVCGLDGKLFDAILASYLKRRKKASVRELRAEHLEEIVTLYLGALAERGLRVPVDVYEQLRLSVSAVYRSWFAERAVQFRNALHVSEYWGTSVLVMQMICGNERYSGASVFFTREPVSMKAGVYGDTRENATGADLADGRLISRPLARRQSPHAGQSLEEIDPDLFRMHEDLAVKIEETMKKLPQEVEATYTTGPDGERLLYVLQTKRMELHRGFTRRFQDVCNMHSKIVGRGVGIHGGALSGVATFSSGSGYIRKLREDTGMPVILLREMVSTNDVSLMPEVDGMLTVTGGVASHASILAQKFDLTAIVGCTDMRMDADEKSGPFAKIGTYAVREGTIISIDGSTGLVYSGSCEDIFWARGHES